MAHLNTTQNSVVEWPTIQPHETVTFGETLPTASVVFGRVGGVSKQACACPPSVVGSEEDFEVIRRALSTSKNKTRAFL